jgi:hypothetical protein
MPDTYVRFVTPMIDDTSDKRQGVFQAVVALLDTHELADHEREELQAIGKWFDRHLGVPKRFARSSKRHAEPKAISWFKASATEHIDHMRTVCRILNEHGIVTNMITSIRPGYVVYEDKHQIAAVPFSETTT